MDTQRPQKTRASSEANLPGPHVEQKSANLNDPGRRKSAAGRSQEYVERLLSIDDVVRILGVTRAAIYSWTHKKTIPHIKLSRGCLRFREGDIMAWLEERAAGQVSSPEKRSVKPIQRPALTDDSIDDIIEATKREILNHGR